MTITARPGVDAGGYDIGQTRDFIAQGREAATLALEPARALLDASAARAIAVPLYEDLVSVGALFESVLVERERLESDVTTRTEILREQWDAFGAQMLATASTLDRQISTRIDELNVALQAEALPRNDDPAAVLVARGEIEIAMRLKPFFLTLVELAERGGDLAAAAASEWGRLTLIDATGAEDGFDSVQEAAIQASLAGEDEGRRRAAAALQATRTPRQGQTVASLTESQTFASYVLGVVIAETIKIGIVPGRGAAAR